MEENELPTGERSPLYRFFEMLPAALSIATPLAVIVLTVVDLRLAVAFVAVFVAITIFKGLRTGIDAIRGYRRLRAAESVDWGQLNAELDAALDRSSSASPGLGLPRALPAPFAARHAELLARLRSEPTGKTAPSRLVHAVVVAAYNEPYEVMAPSIRALTESSIGAENLVVVFAHEERGGEQMRDSVRLLELEFGHLFRAFLPVEHPAGLPDEIPGKGGNITYGGRYLARWVEEQGIDPESVLVTTLDCDNRVHPAYFDYVSYEFVRARDPQRLSFQPISLFVNNVWHAPAPTRVIAAGNSLWNLTSTMRPFSLRNFASHTQPLAALIEMDFWSRRTIVEDGHQYWRSFFHFRGDYGVVPVHVPIYQDAVLAENLPRTLRAQFKQLCRWAYGASDVPFVGVRMLERERAAAPFGATLRRFILLLDSHVTLSTIAPMLAFGVWIPSWFAELFGKTLHEPSESILVNGISETERLAQILGLGTAQVTTPSVQAFIQPIPDFADRLAALLPFLVDSVRPLATVAVVVTIVLTLLTLPPRPPEVSRLRNLGMIAQWVLLPITMICYNALSAITSQLRLLLGRYRESFDVTEKAAVPGANPDDARFDVEMWSSRRRSSTG